MVFGLKKWYLMPHSLIFSVIRYGLRVSGAIQEKESCLFLPLGVVAIEKGAFGSSSTTVGRLTTTMCYDRLLRVNKWITQHGDTSATQMYPKVSEEGFPWFNVHEDRQGAYCSCCFYFCVYYTEGTRPSVFGGGEGSGHSFLYILRTPS